ncbi:response regulator transcription factor [Fusobacterium perfoetens]|uniref:response regulator transcription factor n=1 Tax=Fusobacterium perfoetens TaxID=852 RepID=UPI00047FDCCD|nr:response regulator transcription factor [Fusobacterium perfoetens]MCI6152726.1 response regulator transcription factor [Fusobacterium perfoetens]MDY3236620.1 response regulator transcription factor [Fusobacterium perfoetens]
MENKVLIVEDEVKLRRIMKDFLQKENYKVIESGDGIEAVDLFFSEKPDIIVLDVMLPGLNGFEVLKEIREIDKTIPVIMLTARGNEDDVLKGYELKVDEYIVKPVSLKVLVAKIKAFLRNKTTFETIIFGGLNINVESMEISLDGIPIDLSSKEFELLMFLIKNRNQVLTRDKIITSLWGYDYEGDLRAVDSQIKRLRKKLNGRYIVTVRGVGYKIEEE